MEWERGEGGEPKMPAPELAPGARPAPKTPQEALDRQLTALGITEPHLREKARREHERN